MSSDDNILAEASYSFPRRVIMRLCGYDYLLYMAFIFEIILLLFALLSFLFADLNTETRTILLIDFVLLAVVITTTVGIIYLCGRFRR